MALPLPHLSLQRARPVDLSWVRALGLVAVFCTACETPIKEPADPVPAAKPSPELLPITAEGIARLIRAAPEPVLLVNVWSTWCAPCVEEFPELIATGNRYRSQGLGLLFVSADAAKSHEEALSFLVAQGAPMPSYIKTGSDIAFIQALHPDWSGTLPATILYDAARQPQFLSEKPVTQASLREPVERLLASTP